MRRRQFVAAAAALAGGGAALFAAGQRISADADYPGRKIGHWLRDAHSLPDISQEISTEVLVAGSGVAGLTAAWNLKRSGVNDLLTVSGPEPYGNAASGKDGELCFSTGAHSLGLPSLESRHVREMLHEFGILNGDPYAARPQFDSRFLVPASAARLLYGGRWQAGTLPKEGVSSTEQADHSRFLQIVAFYRQARGSDGKRAFSLPLEGSSADEQFLKLDQYSLRTWLQESGFTAPTLYWYLDYCCRDTYGRHMDEISAWAGLHVFCSREGLAANAEPGARLAWPQGLAALTAQLEASARLRDQWLSGAVAQLRVSADGVEALVISESNSGWRTTRVRARFAVAAMPLHVLQHVFTEGAGYGFVAQRDVPRYAPWVVSNFILSSTPSEREGVPLSWTNAIYGERGLQYLANPSVRYAKATRRVFTGFHALADVEPEAARTWLDRASVKELSSAVMRDMKRAYGWHLPLCLERVAITVRAHAMAVPEPGFLSNTGRIALRSSGGPLYFAHSDLSGLSLFEEASWWGYRAARQIIAKRGA